MKSLASIAFAILAFSSCSKPRPEANESGLTKEKILQIEYGNPGEVFSVEGSDGPYKAASPSYGGLLFKDFQIAKQPFRTIQAGGQSFEFSEASGFTYQSPTYLNQEGAPLVVTRKVPTPFK